MSVFFVCFVRSILSDHGIFVFPQSDFFKTHSVLFTHSEGAAFLFLLCKLLFTDSLHADKQCHSSMIVLVTCIAFYFLI